MTIHDDVLREMTDRGNLSSVSDTDSGWCAISISSVLTALGERGLAEPEARDLALGVLDDLGGRVETQTMSGGLAADRRVGRSQRVAEAWYVPRGAVHE